MICQIRMETFQIQIQNFQIQIQMYTNINTQKQIQNRVRDDGEVAL